MNDEAVQQRDWKILKALHPEKDFSCLTSAPSDDSLLFWLSNTCHSVEPIVPVYQRLEYMIDSHPSLFRGGLDYFKRQFARLYPNISFAKYEEAVAIILSHSLYDYQLSTTLTKAGTVLDYCGGFGRNVPVFQQNANVRYILAETLPCTVHCFKSFNQGIYEELKTVEDCSRFINRLSERTISFVDIENFGIIPDRSLGAVIFTWAFYEMDEPSAKESLRNIARVVANDGAILLRDVPNRLCHSLSFEEEIARFGFSPSYRCADERSFGITTLFHRDDYLENSGIRKKGWQPYVKVAKATSG